MPYRTKLTAPDFNLLDTYFSSIGECQFMIDAEERDGVFYMTFYAENGGILKKLKKYLPFKFWKIVNRKRINQEKLKAECEEALELLETGYR